MRRTALRAGLDGQLLRFAVTGSLSVSLDFLLYRALWWLTGMGDLAKAVSFAVAATVAYLLNRKWTFGVSGGAGKMAGFVALYLVTLLVNVGVNAVALRLLPGGTTGFVAAFLIAQSASTSLNFVGLRTVVFRPSDGVSAPRDVQVSALN